MAEMPDIESLLETLQGTMGRSPMQSLSPLGQFGASLAGFGAGTQGHANPVLAQIQGQQDAKIRQQVQMMQLRQSVERQRFDKAKFINDLANDALHSPDQATRDFGAKTKGEVLRGLDLDPSPSVLSGYAKKLHTEKEIEAAGRYLELFEGDAGRAAELSGVALSVVQDLAKGRKNDAYSQIVYGKSLAQRQKEAVDLSRSEYGFWQSKHPMNLETGTEASLLAREKFPGQSLETLPDVDRDAIVRLAQTRIVEQEQKKERRKLDDQITLAKKRAEFKALGSQLENQQVAGLATHGIVLVDKTGTQYDGDPLAMSGPVIKSGYEPLKLATAKELQGGKYAFKLFGNMRAQSAKLAQSGKLAQLGAIYDKAAQSSPDYKAAQAGDPGAIERLTTYVKYNIGNFTKDPDILIWAGMESEMIIALRGMGEKGLRAIQAFSGAMSVMKTGQYAAIDGYIRNLETSAATQFDQKWQKAFRTTYIARDKKTGAVGPLTLDPGEALDLTRYQIMPEFGLPPR